MRTSFAWGFLAMAAMLAGLDRASAQSESLPIVAIKPAESKVQEGSDPIKFTLSLDEAFTANLDVQIEPGQSGDWLFSGQLKDFMVTIPKGEISHDRARYLTPQPPTCCG